jgi:ketopantoate hydroxymethyltransferase
MQSTARKPIRITPLPRPGRRVVERRKQRSSSAAEALQLALSAAADEGQLDVVLIADDFGMLVSSSRTTLDLEMLAAITPIVSRGRAKASIKRNGEHRDLSVKSIRVLEETLHIAALGGDPSARALGVMRSVTVARRLLS